MIIGRAWTPRVIALLAAIAVPSHAATVKTPLKCISASGIKTEAEVESVPSDGIYVVNVTFIEKRPTDKEVDRVLRDCLAEGAKLHETVDILGSPWFRFHAGDSLYDDELLHPYGGLRYLSYTAASKSIAIHDLVLPKKK